MGKLLLSLLTAAFLAGSMTGCATAPVISAEERKNADYGMPPTNEAEVLAALRAWHSRTLKDPYSAVYRVNMTPYKYAAHDTSGKKYFGWIVAYGMNAKNSYGGYAGESIYTAFFVKGRLVQVYEMINNNQDSIPRSDLVVGQ